MKIELLKSKIHRATITLCDLNYEGSISIDENLMKKAGLVEFEKVLVVNINNANRLETYVIKAEPDSGEIGLNGAAARLAVAGDKVIIMSFAQLDTKEIENFKPKIVFVDNKNNFLNLK
jgi:aspartate 1-decarboxylase